MAPEPGYIFEQLTADPELIHNAQLDAVAERLPGFDATNDVSVEAILSRAFAGTVAVQVEVMSDVHATILTEVGKVGGLEQEDAVAAVGTATIETDGTATRSLPAGATFVATAADQSKVPVVTTQDVDVPEGVASVAGVQVRAVEEGAFANDLTGDLEPDQAYAWLEAVTLDGPLGGGADGETDEEFLDRVSRRQQLLADALIKPENVQLFVTDLPDIGRAVAFNLLDPSAPGVETERSVTVAATDSDGEALNPTVKAAVVAELEARRETNFQFFVIDATYTTVDVALTAYAWPEEMSGAADAIENAVLEWLSPANWGVPFMSVQALWSNTAHVRRSDVIGRVERLDSVDWVDTESVKLNGANTDLALTGIAPLTRPGDITITVLERTP